MNNSEEFPLTGEDDFEYLVICTDKGIVNIDLDTLDVVSFTGGHIN